MIEILYTYTGGYEPIVGTSICSVCENHVRGGVRFHAIVQNIKPSEKKKMREMVESYGNQIVFYECGDMENYFGKKIDTHSWHPIVIARLLLDNFLPKETKRVIYLDGDTMVRGSLEELFNLDLKGNTIAMSIEPTIELKRISKFGLDEVPYCNSGVILFDLEKWRHNRMGRKILDYIERYGAKLKGLDQDSLNIVLRNQILFLPPKYNYGSYYNQYPYRFFRRRCKKIGYEKIISFEDYEDSRKNPLIIHFLGEDRPWREGNHHRFREEYLQYRKLTPWKDVPEDKGWRLYYICWDAMNFCTKPFPGLRLFIIHSLGYFVGKINEAKIKKEGIKK